MNNISLLLSSEQGVSTNNMRSTDMVSVNIPLCGTASMQSCRSAHISVTTFLCLIGCTGVRGILHCDVLRFLFDTLPLRLHCNNTIRILALLIKGKWALSLTYSALGHGGVWKSRHIDLYFLDLCTSWKWVARFTPQKLYSRERPRVPIG
jgi:hypothetical protein